jgi:hypothetical protein
MRQETAKKDERHETEDRRWETGVRRWETEDGKRKRGKGEVRGKWGVGRWKREEKSLRSEER